MLKEFMNKREGQIFISILLGIGLAAIFQRACKKRSCIVLKAPNPKLITNSTYKNEGECYKYNPTITPCPSKQEVLTEHKELVYE